jgi:hypothetical protein
MAQAATRYVMVSRQVAMIPPGCRWIVTAAFIVSTLAPTPALAVPSAMPSVGSQTMRTLLGGGRPLAWRDQLRPVSADT